ncbi:MAG TPA: CapA family protein [Caproicibacter sp.]|nr:CapA family protein [Caproicibacter sp.]
MPGWNPERLRLRIKALLAGDRYRYSQPVEGNFNCLAAGEFDWWKFKYYIRQIEKAEKGKEIEHFFRQQELSFLPDGFQKESEFVLTAGGDLLPGSEITPQTTEHLWDDIQKFYFNADTVYANLETPFAISQQVGNAPKSGIKDAPTLNGTAEMFRRFVNGGKGITFFSTANNHCLDAGESGLIETLNFLDAQGYPHVGTARTKDERDEIPIIEKNGIKIAFVSYTFSLNGKTIPDGKDYLTNYIRLNKPDSDISLIRQHVLTARHKGADIVIACLHWSLEFESYPVSNVIHMGHRVLKETGADVILGNHAHVIQPLEKYHFTDPVSGEEKDGLIAYSLGNLVSDFNTKNCRTSILLKIVFAKGTMNGKKATVIESLKIYPIYTLKKYESGVCKDFRLLDFFKLTAELREGTNRFGFSGKEQKEIYRLERLFYQLLPEKSGNLLERVAPK